MIGTTVPLNTYPSKLKLTSSGDSSPVHERRTPTKKFSGFNIGFRGNADDNCSRKNKAREFIQDLKVKLDIVQKDQATPLKLKEKIKENNDSLYRILDNIFSLYNMSLQIIIQDQSDSAIKIDPVPHTARAVHCLSCIALVLNKFPYSFLKTIELNRFTICQRTYLKNEQHANLYNNRVMMNAIFMIDFHDTFEKVERHFLRIVLYHIQKKCPALYSEWPREKLPLSSTKEAKRFLFPKNGVPSPTNSKKSLSPMLIVEEKKQRKGNINLEETKAREVLETFHKLIKNPKQTLENGEDITRLRASFIQEKVGSVDSVGICDEWWEELPKFTHYVIEGPSGEFAIKY